MRRPRRLALALLLLMCWLALPGTTVGAPDDDFDFYADGPYREDVPRPESILGYEVGTWHTTYGRMERYFTALAEAAPDRIRVRQYGTSIEHRRLWIAAIGSPDNLERLEQIREANLRLTDPRSTDPEEAASIIAGNPTIVWLNYANDGNETAALEAAIQAAYQLVAGEGEEARRFRDEAVVLITPAHNPESHERFVAWYNAFAVGDPDPLALEHHAPWGMDTNNNHYQIDLNRDAWPITQRETRAIAAEFLRWRPQVFVDHHGQPDTYFFPPPAIPVNASLPEQSVRWLETFGRGNARAFDAHGWNYMVRENYDLFYPGYWDSWPTLHGATGMTYEVDGGGRKGLAWRFDDATIITFRDAVAHHFTASIASVRTAVDNRTARLGDFHDFFLTAVEEGRTGPVRAFLLDPGHDPRRAAALVTTLLRHGIEVRRATAEFEATGTSHLTGEAESRSFSAGTYVVDLAQPDKRMAETLLSRESELDPEFVQEQLARWARNARRGAAEPKERYQFYDVTSWSLPFAFDVDAWALSELPGVETEAVEPTGEGLRGGGAWEQDVVVAVPGLRPGADHRVEGDADPATEGARTAYLFEPGTEGALRLLAGLMREGFNVQVARRPLVAAAQEFPRGTFVALVSRNPEGLHERIDALAVDAGVEVHALNTAFNEYGGTGVGSRSMAILQAPRVGMLAGEGIGITGFGAAWFTLERRLGYPFTALRPAQLRAADLGEFDLVVLPDLSRGDLAHELGDDGLGALRAWIEDGGTLLTWGSGAAFARRHGLASVDGIGEEQGASEKAAERAAAVRRIDEEAGEVDPRPPAISPGAEPDRPQPLPGTVLRAELDRSHWLTYGYADSILPVLVRGDDFMPLSARGANPIVFPDDAEPLRISGFVWPGNTEPALAGTAHAVVEPRGRGQVVLLGTDPNFRLAWRATLRLFANAVLLGPSMR